MNNDPYDPWLQFADKWRERAKEYDNDTWRYFCYKNVAFGEEMSRTWPVL